MATPSKARKETTRQHGATVPERRISKSQRPAPGKTLGQADREEETASTDSTDDAAAREYDSSAAAGITNLPPEAEEEQQSDLPPRGSRKADHPR